MRCKIIYEDEKILVIHKPAGLATQSAAVGQPDAVSELKKYLVSNGKAPYLGIVHRLDQPVEGLLVFAKTPDAAAALSKALAGKTLNKRYYAAVCGIPRKVRGELEDDLRKEGNLARIVTGQAENFPDAKRAKLSYRLELSRQTPKGEISLLEVQIETGRFHQIRAQLSHAGFPILGDQKYGTEASKALGRALGFQTVGLCAYSLELRHPKTKKMLTWECKPSWIETVFKSEIEEENQS